METVLLQINNDKAYKLLEDLEALDIVKVLERNSQPKQKLSERFAGALKLSAEEYTTFQNSITKRQRRVGKRYLIDSNVVIGYLDNKLPQSGMELMHAIIDETPNISVITKIEVLRFNTSDDSYAILEDFVAESIVFEINDQVVDKTIALYKTRKIKLPDAVIAATALVNDLTLLSRNISDFKNIDSLELINPWA